MKINSPVEADSILLNETAFNIIMGSTLGRWTPKNSPLAALMLQNNKIGDKGAQYLAGALKHNSSITQLNVDWNEIGVEGVKHFAKQKGAGDLGAQYLAEELKIDKSLVRLNRKGNRKSNTGVQLLGNALKQNSSIIESKLANWDPNTC
eukprot:Pgem_evm1s18137